MADSNNEGQPRYPKPKIMLIDLPESIVNRLKTLGFNATRGTLGQPYPIEPKQRAYIRIEFNGTSLPHLAEQEIICIDLQEPDAKPVEDGEVKLTKGYYVSAISTPVDPRPVTASFANAECDRILANGGVFIIFCEARSRKRFEIGQPYYGEIDLKGEVELDLYSFLSILSSEHVEIRPEHGTEMTSTGSTHLHTLLSKACEDSDFTVAFDKEWRLGHNGDSFYPLLKNKFDDAVAACVIREGSDKRGIVFLLPQIADKESFLVEFLTETLPDLRPNLYPDLNRWAWLHSKKYEHQSILALRKKQDQIREQTEREISKLDEQIEQTRSDRQYLHDLITETGDKLEKAVAVSLRTLGFANVVEVDTTIEEGSNRQEDIQIHDRRPIILCEVKGIASVLNCQFVE